MQRAFFFILFAFNIFGQEKVFNLKESIEYARKFNPDILINQKELEGESLNIEIEKSSKYPSIDLFSSGSRFKYPYPITPISFEGGKLIIPDFDKSIYNFGFSIYFPVYKGGRLEKAISLSKIKKDINEIKFKNQKMELEYGIANLYFKILEMERLLKALKFSVEQMEIHKNNAEKFYEAGIVPKIDLIKADVEVSRAKENFLTASNNLKIYYELFKSLIGFEGSEDIKLEEKEYFKDFEIGLEKAIEEGLSKRFEVVEIEKKKKFFEEKYYFIKGNKLPDIFLSQDFLYSSGNSLDFENNWGISLKMRYPLFEGGKTKFELKKIEIEIEKLKEEERRAKIQIEREIREANLNLQNAKKRIEVLKDSIVEAKENLRIEQILYEAGSNTSKDVIDAENSLLQTETGYYNAIFEKNKAILDFNFSMGNDLIEILKEF